MKNIAQTTHNGIEAQLYEDERKQGYLIAFEKASGTLTHVDSITLEQICIAFIQKIDADLSYKVCVQRVS